MALSWGALRDERIEWLEKHIDAQLRMFDGKKDSTLVSFPSTHIDVWENPLRGEYEDGDWALTEGGSSSELKQFWFKPLK